MQDVIYITCTGDLGERLSYHRVITANSPDTLVDAVR